MGKKKKKWTRQKCRDRYVQGEKIGQRALAEQSGRAASVIGAWCSEDGWVQQREQYQSELSAITHQKTIEKTSDRLSDELTLLNTEHLELFKTIREVSATAIKVLAKDAMGDRNTAPEERARNFKSKALSLAMHKYVNNAVNAANMERAIAGARFSDLNIAIDAVIKSGYEVVEPMQE